MKINFLLLILIISLLYSCSNSTNFNEYSGVNLIENQDFTSADWTITTEATNYMNFTTTTETSTTGLPSGSTATTFRKLEIKNMLPSGDFEGGSSDWTILNANASIDYSTPTNSALNFNVTNPTTYISFNFDDFIDSIESTIITTAVYTINFDCKKNADITNLYFEYVDDSLTTNNKEWIVTAGTSFSDYQDNTSDNVEINTQTNGPHYFRIGGSSNSEAQEGSIDNFRITRSDINHKLEIYLTYSDATNRTGLELISGTYTFSIYVKTDPVAGSSNIFDSKKVEIGIISYNTTTEIKKAYNVEEYSTSNWNNWTKIEVSSFFQTYNNAVLPCLKLYVSPSEISNSTNIDVGSILIASPTLEFSY